MRRGKLLFIFIICILFGCFSLAWGADRGKILPAETMIGHLSSPGFTDSWNFYGDAGDRVVITSGMISGYVRPEIYLYPPGSGPLEASHTGGAYSHRLDHQLEQTGLYTIVISDYSLSRSGNYGIALVKIPGQSSSATDPDGGPIASGVTKTGTLTANADTDIYPFHGDAGDRVVITSGMISGYVRPEIYLYPPGSEPLEASHTGGAYSHRLDHQLEQTGLYTIVISDYSLSRSGDYGIALVKIPGPSSSATDPDGGPIASGVTKTGTLTANADTDIYPFHGDAGDRVVITSGMISGYVRPEIYLYPPGSEPLEASHTGGAYSHSLDHQLEQTGLYTIVISDYSLSRSGDYGIALVKMPGPSSSATDPDGGPITSGVNKTGTLTANADTDIYPFYGDAGDRVVIASGMISGYVRPEIYLYPPGSEPLEASHTGGAYSHSLDHQLEQTGLYTIVISDYSLSRSGNYGMSLTKIPNTKPKGIYNPHPSNAASISDLSDFFSWDPAGGATGYDVYFGEDVIAPLRKIRNNIQSSSTPFPAMNPGKVYYWQVVAHTSIGDIEGPYWWFATVGFADVPPDFWAFDHIMAIYKEGITKGCSQNPLKYCPKGDVTRDQMAAFIVRAVEGEPDANYCDTGSPFSDVPSTSLFCKYIKRLSEMGITQGCGGGKFCPKTNVTREQMAAFLVRAVEGEPDANYCDTGSPFSDVSPASVFCKYIKRLSELEITQGCGGGKYCPKTTVKRDQMAVFLGRAFLGMD